MSGACRILACLGLAAMCGCASPWVLVPRDAFSVGDRRGAAADGGGTVVNRKGESPTDTASGETGPHAQSAPQPASQPPPATYRDALVAELAQMLVDAKKQHGLNDGERESQETHKPLEPSDAGGIGHDGQGAGQLVHVGGVGRDGKAAGLQTDVIRVVHAEPPTQNVPGQPASSPLPSNSLRHDVAAQDDARYRTRFEGVFDEPATPAEAVAVTGPRISAGWNAASDAATDAVSDSATTVEPKPLREPAFAARTPPLTAPHPSAAAEDSPLPKEQRLYQDALDEAMALLELELKDEQLDDDQRTRRAVALRLLRLASQRPKDWPRASEAIAHLDQASEKEFWTHALFALATMLDADELPRTDQRARATLVELRDALGRLSDLSTLEVQHLAFCTEVQAYGRYIEFPENRFQPGQEVILYAEVENFMAEQKRDGYETALEGTCEIYDAGGRKASVHKFDLDKELCRNRRRDFFLPYHYWIPQDLLPGAYSLKLTVKDVKANKMDQATIKFTVDSRR